MVGLVSCQTRKLKKVSINNAVISLYNFKPGTYWVYRDSVTGGLDSFVVRTSLYYSQPMPDSYMGPYDVEKIEIPVEHYYNGVITRNAQSYVPSVITLVQDSCVFRMVMGDTTRIDSVHAGGGAATYPLKNASLTMMVNGTVYNNVAKRGREGQFYWCNEAAFLIKFYGRDNDDRPRAALELLRYNIVK